MNMEVIISGGPYICDECRKLFDEIILMELGDYKDVIVQLCEKCAVKFANNLTTLLKF